MRASCRRAVGVDLGEQGYVVARVTKVLPRDPALASEQNLQGQYAQAVAQRRSAGLSGGAEDALQGRDQGVGSRAGGFRGER